METIVYAHPYSGSFNNAELNQVIKINQKMNRKFQVIDLYAEKFEPAYTAAELKLFSSGESLDPKVKKYQAMLKDSDRITFIFPVWWSNIPSIVKGFIDKTMIPGFATMKTVSGTVISHGLITLMY